jgi:hypothetical protein
MSTNILPLILEHADFTLIIKEEFCPQSFLLPDPEGIANPNISLILIKLMYSYENFENLIIVDKKS